MRDYLRIHTTDKKIMTLMNFSTMESILPADKFIRIHRSFMVAIDKINVIKKDSVSVNNSNLTIGRNYKKQFFELVIKLLLFNLLFIYLCIQLVDTKDFVIRFISK